VQLPYIAALCRELVKERGDPDPRVRHAVGQAYHVLGICYAMQGKHEEAGQNYHEARAFQTQLLKEFPGDLVYRQDLAVTYTSLAEMHRAQGRPAEADAADLQAMELFSSLPPDLPRLSTFTFRVAQKLYNMGKLAESLPWQDQTAAQLEVQLKQEQSPERRKSIEKTLQGVNTLRGLTRAELVRRTLQGR
jgi:tetratricopeptide (TPR) repeat protein